MNIHQLLSVSQSSPQTQSPGAFSRQDPVNGLFQQALLNASDTQRRLLPAELSGISTPQAPLQQKQLDALSNLASDTLGVDAESLSTALEALGLVVSESDFSKLLAQLQLPNSNISVDTLGLASKRPSTPLDEIADRLTLMASFSDGSAQRPSEPLSGSAILPLIAEQLNLNTHQTAQLADTPALKTVIQSLSMDNSGFDAAALEAIAEKLNITQTEAVQLADTPAFKTLVQSLSIDSSGFDAAALEAIADQLNITQTEAAQLVSALNGLVGQQHSAESLSADPARSSDTRSPVAELQIASRSQQEIVSRSQQETVVSQPNTSAQINTTSAAPAVSTEALIGALLAADGAPKGSQSGGEQLAAGFTLNSSANPLPLPQSAQPYTPAPPPTAATLATPFASPAWPQQLSQQLVQISQRGGDQHVQMQLNPAELGPLSISLKFSEQGAQAHFLSAHAQVRQVLEQAIPQLREALAEQGISLGETSVGEQRDPNEQAFAQSSNGRGAKAGSDSGEVGSDETAHQSTESKPLALDGRVDLYA